ncbi:MAG: hypothetical protein ACLU0O_08190 [Collinsella sp.]
MQRMAIARALINDPRSSLPTSRRRLIQRHPG